ncbi:MAG: patatin-like phospholipase family protein [Alphaproteobacteria bacterium]|nr:MAG: patatin-like phospholipase family protein [Alphaproteobacteria bacterium]
MTRSLPGEKNVLVLQGGGALGAYQAGAYSALHEMGYEPAWLAGISIGSINSAIIAGNPPEKRISRLKEFWDRVSGHVPGQGASLFFGEIGRRLYNEASAAEVATFGVEGFFTPRFPPPIAAPWLPRPPEALSHYDTAPLRETLLELVDFDRLNHDGIRLSVGAVNVKSGNFTYFDTAKTEIRPEHIMASGALPEGFPPIEIDGEWYWDGGLVSNTPLQYVIDVHDKEDLCIFQVDLFSARGAIPENLLEASQRIKDIRFSSRTRLNTDVFRQTQAARRLIGRLLEKIPDELLSAEDFSALESWSCDSAVTIAHLIYRQAAYHTQSKDYEFSRLSIDEHWKSGAADADHLLHHKSWMARGRPRDGVQVFDCNRHFKA